MGHDARQTSKSAESTDPGGSMLDQVLGIGGLSLLVFLVVRITVVLRAAWKLQQEGEADPFQLDV